MSEANSNVSEHVHQIAQNTKNTAIFCIVPGCGARRDRHPLMADIQWHERKVEFILVHSPYITVDEIDEILTT